MLDTEFDGFKATMIQLWPKMAPEEIGGWFKRFKAAPLGLMQGVLADFKASNRWSPKYQQIEAIIRENYPDVLPVPEKARQPATVNERDFDHAAQIRSHNPKVAGWNDAATLLWFHRYTFFRRLKTRCDRSGNVSDQDREFVNRVTTRECQMALTAAGYEWEASKNAAQWISTPRNEWEPFIHDIRKLDMPKAPPAQQDDQADAAPDDLDESIERRLLGITEEL